MMGDLQDFDKVGGKAAIDVIGQKRAFPPSAIYNRKSKWVRREQENKHDPRATALASELIATRVHQKQKK